MPRVYSAEPGGPRQWNCGEESIELTANSDPERPRPDRSAAGLDRYQLAILLVLAGSFANSTNGLLMRSIEQAGPWQVIAIRSGALSVTLVGVFLVQQRHGVLSALRRLGPWSLLGAALIGTAHSAFIWSMNYTTVANTMFILSAVPFLTALLGWILLKESVSPRLWAAMLAALGGIGIMFAGGMGAGTLLGNALALLAALSYSGFVVILRHGRTRNMLPMVILGAILSFGYSATMAGFDFAMPVTDFAISYAWGGILSSMVHVFFVFSSRYVKGAELTLAVLLEFILAPIWVWLAFAERPSVSTLVGGALVLAAVGSRGILALRKRG